jgi:hypothetical protein
VRNGSKGMGKRRRTQQSLWGLGGGQYKADVGDHVGGGKREVDKICGLTEEKGKRSLKQCSKDPGGQEANLGWATRHTALP